MSEQYVVVRPVSKTARKDVMEKAESEGYCPVSRRDGSVLLTLPGHLAGQMGSTPRGLVGDISDHFEELAGVRVRER